MNLENKENLEMIIFDLDGTLWDTIDITVDASNEILKREKLDIRVNYEIVKNGMGHNLKEVSKMYMPDLEEEKRMSLKEEMDNLTHEKILKNGAKLYPDVRFVLENLKEKYKLAIVSNCGDGHIESFIEYYHFKNIFDDYIPASKYGISKAEAIKEVMNRNNVKNAIFIGDTEKDYEASKEARIPFIHAIYGFGKIDDNNIVSINNLKDLLLINIKS